MSATASIAEVVKSFKMLNETQFGKNAKFPYLGSWVQTDSKLKNISVEGITTTTVTDFPPDNTGSISPYTLLRLPITPATMLQPLDGDKDLTYVSVRKIITPDAIPTKYYIGAGTLPKGSILPSSDNDLMSENLACADIIFPPDSNFVFSSSGFSSSFLQLMVYSLIVYRLLTITKEDSLLYYVRNKNAFPDLNTIVRYARGNDGYIYNSSKDTWTYDSSKIQNGLTPFIQDNGKNIVYAFYYFGLCGNSSTEFEIAIKQMVNDTFKYNPIVVQKLANLYYRLCQIYILWAAYINNKSGNYFSPLYFINQLFLMLQNDIYLINQASFTEFNQNISTNMNNYNGMQMSLQDLSKKFNDARAEIDKRKQDVYDTNNKYKASKGYEYITLIIALFVIGFSFTAVMGPVDDSMRIKFAAGAVAGAVILSIIMHLVFGVLYSENFAILSDYSKVKITTNADPNDISPYIRRIAADYIDAINNIGVSYSTNKLLNNINSKVRNEHNFYDITTNKAVTINSNMMNVQNAQELERRWVSSRLNLYLSLALITSVTALLYLSLSFWQVGQKIILGIGSILAIFAILISVAEMVSYVRTDGNKYYWNSVPDTK